MAIRESLQQHLNDIYNKCLHCGLCLPTCPTYNIDLREESSPRGRIQLIHSFQNNELALSKNFINEMYFCLDCQACETACPAGVRFSELIEESRNMISDKNQEGFILKLFKMIFLRVILSSTKRTKTAARVLRAYQSCGLKDAVVESGVLKLFSDQLHEKHQLLPTIQEKFFDEEFPEIIKPKGDIRGRVAFLSGCIMNVAFTDIHRDAVYVLIANGFEVVIPRGQVCCGSLHDHNGEIDLAKKLARKNIEIFENYKYDALVVDSAGCSAFMKKYSRIFTEDEEYADRAKIFSQKVKEITEFFSEVGLTMPLASVNQKVTYHEACHLVHTQKISQQPRGLIQSIPGIELIELPEATWCCGSAGIYNVIRYDDSMKILDRKIKNLESTGANITVTANPGCHLQIQYGIKRYGLKMQVMHPISLLWSAYDNKS